MTYEILSTGSKGNAVVINGNILIDCGVSFKMLKDVYNDLALVLLTHIHSDHFKASTIRILAEARPMLRFGCGEWLVKPLLDCGVSKSKIDVYEADFGSYYGEAWGSLAIEMFAIPHDVPNCGYKVHTDKGKLFYATDTNSLSGITAKNYDLYMIEGNHDIEEIKERIRNKEKAGEYPYERRARENHLSREAANDFIYQNIGPAGEYVYLHTHTEEPEAPE